MEMGIDYHEDSQFSGFLDEFNNADGIPIVPFLPFIQVGSIVNKKEKDIRAEGDRARVDAQWRVDPNFEKSCTYLNMRLQQLGDAIKTELDKNPGKAFIERTINPMKEWESKYKALLTRNNCVDTKLAQERDAEQRRAMEQIYKASQVTPDLIDTPAQGSNMNKYLIFGVGGLILLVVGVAILKR
jgi:hypothetical protein